MELKKSDVVAAGGGVEGESPRRGFLTTLGAGVLACSATASAEAAGSASDEDSRRGWLVPVGGVIMWWGDEKDIPIGFEICDGNVPTTKGAKLQSAKPNIQDCFPKGALATRKTLAELATARGGSHDLPGHIHTIPNLSIGNVGSDHDHAVRTNSSHEPLGQDGWLSRGNTKHQHSGIVNGSTDKSGLHVHNLVGHVGTGPATGVSGDVNIAGANQPAYAEMFFIIRVR